MDVVVTDLTRFNNQEFLCIAGLCSQTANCVRPMPYIPRDKAIRLNIQPGSVLRGDFVAIPTANAPHVEDHSWPEIQVLPQVSSEQFESLLIRSSSSGVRSGFGVLPNNRVFGVAPTRSIITICLDAPSKQLSIGIDNFGKMKATFTDGDGDAFRWVPITDLGFYNYISSERNNDPELKELNGFIQNANSVYLRIGLSRYHEAAGRSGFWMQVNGVYTFPLYSEQLRSYG